MFYLSLDRWMAELTGSDLPPAATFTTNMRNGVALAKLAKKFDFSAETQSQRIYDPDESVYRVCMSYSDFHLD